MSDPWSVRILRIRSRLNVTQERFAELLGLSAVSVNRWEGSHASPSGFSKVVLELLEELAPVRPVEEVLRRLATADGEHKAITRMLVWLACEAPPSSLRPSSPDLLAGRAPPASTQEPPSTPAGPPPG